MFRVKFGSLTNIIMNKLSNYLCDVDSLEIAEIYIYSARIQNKANIYKLV